jgi:hypothetical protein
MGIKKTAKYIIGLLKDPEDDDKNTHGVTSANIESAGSKVDDCRLKMRNELQAKSTLNK